MSAEITIWRVDLDRHVRLADQLITLLTDEERNRASRIRDAEHKRRWVVGRAATKCVLSQYAETPPASIDLHFEKHGKPRLSDHSSNPRLHCNLSHSKRFAVLAITEAGPIGVDVEWIRELDDIDRIVRLVFASAEQEVFDRLPRSRRLSTFYKYWTCKEAYLKGLGTGFSRAPNTFAIDIGCVTSSAIRVSDREADDNTQWAIISLSPSRQYAAAVAVASDLPLEIEWRTVEPAMLSSVR